MATSLRDISGRRAARQAARQPVLFDPRQGLGLSLPPPSRRRPGLFERRRRPRLTLFDALLATGVLAILLFLANGLWSSTRVDVDVTGLEDEQAFTFERATQLAVTIEVSPTKNLSAAELTFDGEPLDAEVTDAGFYWKPAKPLTAGAHRIELRVPRPILPESHFRWDFVVDATPPVIETERLLQPHGFDDPVTITGSVDEDAELTANGEEVDLDDGRFELEFDTPPAGPILLVATDAAGHQEKVEVFVPMKRPLVRAVHMSAISWRTRNLKEPVMRLIEDGKINAVELDLKDEGGEVGYDSEIALAEQIGATKRYYDLEKAVDELHERGVRVIGRIVAFRDPILAKAAFDAGERDMVVQRPDGSMHGAYGGFTNFANPRVQQYNLDIAAEAVAAGVDEILWDYIRRPEGDITQIVFPGITSTPRAVEDEVVDFLAESHRLVREAGVFQGASVFGIAAKRPDAIGQNIGRISRHVDYLAPMVYPSLWVAGEYRVADPPNMPYEIVRRSLEDFREKSKRTGVQMTPWLQDFSLGTTYDDDEVRAQIDAAASLDIGGWLLWSPRVRYNTGMLPTLDD